MTQETIVTALRKALDCGVGSLDDLSNLLDCVQTDIGALKLEQAKAKRVKECKDMADRLIDYKVTTSDIALVLNTYAKQNKININITDKDAGNIFELIKSIDDLATAVANTNTKSVDKIHKFLSDNGLL